MSNIIQIKRSPSTAAPGSLNAGELAYSNVGGGTGVLYIGSTDGGSVVAIGGQRVPGTLTANQALVANSTSGINHIIAANVDVLSYLTVNGSVGSAGWALFSGGAGANAYWASVGSLSVNTASQYTWTNTQTFQNTITFSSVITVGNSTVNLTTNNTVLTLGNTSINISINSTSFSGTANNALYLGGTLASSYQLNSTLAANIAAYLPTYTGTVNGAIFQTGAGYGTATGGYTANQTIMGIGNTTVNTIINTSSFSINGTLIANSTGANNAFYLGGTAAASYVTTSGNYTLAGNNIFAGTNTVVSSNLTVSGATIKAPTSVMTLQDLTLSGNLIVSGTVETLNASQLIVNDNIIELADGNLTTDTVDAGWYAPAGNSTAIWYSGMARIASLSSNNNAVFRLFASNTSPNTSSTIDATTNTTTSSLYAYLIPYGSGGAFVVNSSAMSFQANSTVSLGIAANTLTLSTALLATQGGTGLSTYASGDVLYAGTANPTILSKLSIPGAAANGQVLQITNNLPAYGVLDGGVFMYNYL